MSGSRIAPDITGMVTSLIAMADSPTGSEHLVLMGAHDVMDAIVEALHHSAEDPLDRYTRRVNELPDSEVCRRRDPHSLTSPAIDGDDSRASIDRGPLRI